MRREILVQSTHPISTLFLDIGGVLLTNGWDRHSRQRAAETFQLDFAEMDERHHLTFDTYEIGKISLEEYLQRVVFYTNRSFSMEEFRTFMFNRSQPYNEMIDLIRVLKARFHLKTVAVSNEGRELTRYRIQQFNLHEVIDAFVSSSFVHLRKPDVEIYHMALDISQSPPEQVVYIDDRTLFVEVAMGIGIQGVHHSGYPATHRALTDLGLGVG
jgi:putative hydrolase of the HAD superfamily